MKKLLLLLTLLPVFVFAQPMVFLGSSRVAVQKYMSYEIRWMLVKSTAAELSYHNPHEKVTISYFFIRNTLGTMRTCIKCMVTLPDETTADEYISERELSCRLRPENENAWTLITDLVDIPIRVTRIKTRIIYNY